MRNVRAQYVLQQRNGYMAVYRFACWVISGALSFLYLQKMDVFNDNY